MTWLVAALPTDQLAAITAGYLRDDADARRYLAELTRRAEAADRLLPGARAVIAADRLAPYRDTGCDCRTCTAIHELTAAVDAYPADHLPTPAEETPRDRL